jgi:hypothetical protein
VTKRAFDIVVSGTMLLLASPVLAIAAVATKLSSGSMAYQAWRSIMSAIEEEDADASSLNARLVAVQIEKIEHALGVSRGEYWSRSEVQKWCAELAAAVRKVVTQIHLVAPSVVGVSVPEAEARLKDLEDEIMRQLHQIGARVGTPANEPGS